MNTLLSVRTKELDDFHDTLDGFDDYLTDFLTSCNDLNIVFHTLYMTQNLDQNIEWEVRNNWLQGKSRDTIAEDCGISTGAVTNIIKIFVASLDGYVIQAIRDFVLKARKGNLTLKECLDIESKIFLIR